MKTVQQKLTGRIFRVRCPRKLKKYLKKYIYQETPNIDAYSFQLRNSASPFIPHKHFYKAL